MEQVNKTQMARYDIKFNYIITIHNKESIIERVISHTIKCMGVKSVLYPVLDGCTDASEQIIDRLISEHPEKKIVKLYADDVHELKSINIGLKRAEQEGDGYNIVLQDDVVLKDFDIETKVIQLYQERPNLGIISFRQGGNISRSLLKKETPIPPIINRIENVKGHNYNPFAVLQLGCFTYREVGIKSPICIPYNVVRTIGVPNEAYAPWDDLAYCYSIIRAGFDNGVYALDFDSDIKWGTTRSKAQKVSVSDVERKNVTLFKKNYRAELLATQKKIIYDNKIYRIHYNTTTAHKRFSLIKGLKTHLRNNMVYFFNILFSK